MTTSDQINEIAAALAKAQGAMKPAIKDGLNPHFKSKYADLAANVEAARAPLSVNGLAVLQEATTVPNGIAVATRLIHSSGQWIQFDPLTVPLAKMDAHGVGSATTYARRYALGAALGLVAEDDDGNAATQAAPRAVAVTPAGFDDWMLDMELVAAEGVDALKAAWDKSKPEYRKHLTSTAPKLWDDLKAKAAKVKREAVSA
jgi:hypothetical protein